MGLYDHWPYTNFHELNLSWLLRLMEDLSNKVDNFVALNTIKYADPIQWNITTQYETNTVVVDPQSGTAYISSKPVPAGVALTNTDYWSVIFTLDMLSANDNITFRDDGSNVLSTFSSVAGDWLLWNGNLYKVTQGINVNEAYVVGYNLERYTVELFIKDYIDNINNIIGDLTDLSTTDKDSIVDAINEVIANIGALTSLTTTDKSSIVNAINELAALTNIYVVDSRSGISSVDAEAGSYIISTNSYTGDGITSYYKVDNSSTADGYFNIALTNGNVAVLIHDTDIHAHQVGAFPNGNDCCPAINAIINTMSVADIQFGVGTYTFNDRIWLNSNQSIYGAGDNTILYISQDPVLDHGEFIGIIGDANNVKENITLRNFDIDIYYLPSATEDVNPIGITAAKNILIENVNVLRSNWRGFQLEGVADAPLENIIIRNCTIKDTYLNGVGISHGVNGSLKNILVDNVHVSNSNQNAGFWIQGTSTTIDMTNIKLKNISYNGGTVRAVYLVNAENITINGLTCNDIALDLYGIVQVQNCNNIAINDYNLQCAANNTNNWGLFVLNGNNILLNNSVMDNVTIGVQINAGNNPDRCVLANTFITIKAGGTPIRNQHSTLKGYISGCVYDGTISNSSSDFVELGA